MKVSYICFEAELARAERHIRRLWLALTAAMAALGLTNIAWLVAAMIH